MTGQVVQVRLWQVPTAHVPGAVGRVGGQRLTLRRVPGLQFAKLLGTGSGETFTVRDADVHRWALLTVFDSPAAAGDFASGPQVRSWDAIAEESLRVDLRALTSVGRWARREPFDVDGPPRRWDGPVAAITRARIRPRMWRTFASSVPPVAADLRARPGVVLAVGIGEAPIGLQGTFSVWESNRALTAFAHRGAAHRAVVDDTARLSWYSEELFARFAVIGTSGTFDGRTLPEPE